MPLAPGCDLARHHDVVMRSATAELLDCFHDLLHEGRDRKLAMRRHRVNQTCLAELFALVDSGLSDIEPPIVDGSRAWHIPSQESRR
jgi:hypothetical protein